MSELEDLSLLRLLNKAAHPQFQFPNSNHLISFAELRMNVRLRLCDICAMHHIYIYIYLLRHSRHFTFLHIHCSNAFDHDMHK